MTSCRSWTVARRSSRGASGLRAACSRGLAAAGATVVVVDLNAALAGQVVPGAEEVTVVKLGSTLKFHDHPDILAVIGLRF